MKDAHPKITILLATFNRAHLIGETLDSFVAQTYRNWECLIVDDHSKDNTEAEVLRYIKKDSRFYYFKKTAKYRSGLSGTRNFGLDLAKERDAEFIQFFDDDDLMHPRKLELQLKPFLFHSEIHFTLCQYRKFYHRSVIDFDLNRADDGLCHIDTENLLKSFYLNNLNLNSSGPLWRAKVLKKYRFLEDLHYAEEREFYLRIFYEIDVKYIPVKRVLFWYRKHDKAITSNLYENQNIKTTSVKVFEEKFLQTILHSKKAPYYLLKSYTMKSLKSNNFLNLYRISSYIEENYNPSYFRLWMLLLYIKLKTFKVAH